MKMCCQYCGVSVFNKPLKRISEIGKDAKWACESCLRRHEPELYKNIMEEENGVEKTLKKGLYEKNVL